MKSLSLHIGGVHQAIQETGNTVLACREEQSAENRRTSPRKQVSLRVDYADAQGRAWWGVARNLSYGGIFLEYPPGLSVGDTIVSVAAHNSNHPDPQTYQMRERRADIPLLVQH